jgi:hypothetical protein
MLGTPVSEDDPAILNFAQALVLVCHQWILNQPLVGGQFDFPHGESPGPFCILHGQSIVNHLPVVPSFFHGPSLIIGKRALSSSGGDGVASDNPFPTYATDTSRNVEDELEDPFSCSSVGSMDIVAHTLDPAWNTSTKGEPPLWQLQGVPLAQGLAILALVSDVLPKISLSITNGLCLPILIPITDDDHGLGITGWRGVTITVTPNHRPSITATTVIQHGPQEFQFQENEAPLGKSIYSFVPYPYRDLWQRAELGHLSECFVFALHALQDDIHSASKSGITVQSIWHAPTKEDACALVKQLSTGPMAPPPRSISNTVLKLTLDVPGRASGLRLELARCIQWMLFKNGELERWNHVTSSMEEDATLRKKTKRAQPLSDLIDQFIASGTHSSKYSLHKSTPSPLDSIGYTGTFHLDDDLMGDLVPMRSDLDWTEKLWEFVHKAANVGDLIDVLTLIVDKLEMGKIYPQVNRNNPTALGAICRECIRLASMQSHTVNLTSTRESVEGSFDIFLEDPMDWLIEVGTWKLSRDLISLAQKYAPVPKSMTYDPAAELHDRLKFLTQMLRMVEAAQFIETNLSNVPSSVYLDLYRELGQTSGLDNPKHVFKVTRVEDDPIDSSSMIEIRLRLPQYSSETVAFLETLPPAHIWEAYFASASSSQIDKVWAVKFTRNLDSAFPSASDHEEVEKANYRATFGSCESVFSS